MQSAVFQVRFSLREKEFLFYPGENILNFKVNAGVQVRDSNEKQFNLTCPIVYEYSPDGLIVQDEISVKRTAFPSAATPFGYLLRVDGQGADSTLFNQEFLVRPAFFTKIIQEDRNSRKDGISYFDFKPFLVRPYKTDTISYPPLGFSGVQGSFGTVEATLNKTFAVVFDAFLSFSENPKFTQIFDSSVSVDMSRKNNTALHIISSGDAGTSKIKINEISGRYTIDFDFEYTNKFIAFHPEAVYMSQTIIYRSGGTIISLDDEFFGVSLKYEANTNMFYPNPMFSTVGRLTIG